MEKYFFCKNCKEITIAQMTLSVCPLCGGELKQGLEDPMSYETKQKKAVAERRYYNARLTKELKLKK
jgi:hypothetical protein